jgi:CBS-domain-containing membrane protein
MAHPEQLQSDMCVADFMSRDLVTVNEHDDMERVFHLFAEHPYTLMPVVRANNPRKAVGGFGRQALLQPMGNMC